MPLDTPPAWTLLPFVFLVLSMAILPLVVPHLWERRWLQVILVVACATPVVSHLGLAGQFEQLLHAGFSI